MPAEGSGSPASHPGAHAAAGRTCAQRKGGSWPGTPPSNAVCVAAAQDLVQASGDGGDGVHINVHCLLMLNTN